MAGEDRDAAHVAHRAPLQSFPALLRGDGEIPALLASPSDAIDLTHRDGRLAIGELRDGTLLIAMTRFHGLAGVFARLPLGLTVPEMAAVTGGLGCRRAVMLDGGASAQLMVRDGASVRAWRGLRRVPVGMVVTAR